MWTWFWQAWMLWTSFTMFCILGIIWLTWHFTFCERVQFILTPKMALDGTIWQVKMLRISYAMILLVVMCLTCKNDVNMECSWNVTFYTRHVHFCWHHILALLVIMLLIKSILFDKFNAANIVYLMVLHVKFKCC